MKYFYLFSFYGWCWKLFIVLFWDINLLFSWVISIIHAVKISLTRYKLPTMMAKYCSPYTIGSNFLKKKHIHIYKLWSEMFYCLIPVYKSLVYTARMQLAVLAHNTHVNHQHYKNKSGDDVYHREYKKDSKVAVWVATLTVMYERVQMYTSTDEGNFGLSRLFIKKYETSSTFTTITSISYTSYHCTHRTSTNTRNCTSIKFTFL